MLVCNDTPFFHGSKLTSRRPPAREMTLVVRGTFRLVPDGVVTVIEDLEQGFLTGETFDEDDPERVGPASYPGDFADFKLRGEVMLRGSCHPPKRPAQKCAVKISVGALTKELWVFGDRRWETGLLGKKPSEPEAFERMPLDYAHAFGGEGFAANPAGSGVGGERLPNVELPGALIQSTRDRPAPASFQGLSSAWPPRSGMWGENYGRAWRKERAPFVADDFDWAFFNAAPADQRLEKGYFRGDEPIVLHNVHPTQAKLSTTLPGLRIRAFVQDEGGNFRAVAMSLDTIYLEPDDDQLKLTWRGVTAVQEDDLEDVAYILIASELLTEEPRSEEHYRARLDAFIADPTGAMGAIPPEMIASYERLQKIQRGEEVPPLELDPDRDALTGTLKATFGNVIPDEQLDAIGRAVPIMAQTPEGHPKLDIKKALEESEEALKNQPPTMRVLKPGSMPPVGLKKRMRRLVEEAATLREKERETGQKIPMLEKLEAIPRHPDLKKMDPDYEVPTPLSTDEPGPGADLREHDLTGRDLRGVDLSGANLAYADLSRANLEGVNLRGANLDKAILWLANLEGADLREASLRMTNAASVRARGVQLQRATLSEAFFENARLAGANLDEATADYVVFAHADLTGAQAMGATFDQSDFSNARLDDAKMKTASLSACLFEACTATGIDVRDANLEQASFHQADFSRALFTGAQASKAFLDGAIIDGADFSWSTLRSAHLTKTSARAARFYGADLQEARLYRARLDGADLTCANLMAVDLRKASAEGASFARASLYDARLAGVTGSYVIDGANTKLAMFEEVR